MWWNRRDKQSSHDGPRKRVWVQNVAVRSAVLESQLDAVEARELSPAEQKIAHGTRSLLKAATAAAFRDDPIPTRWGMWWRGTLVEAAYQNLHAAEGQLTLLYNVDQLRAEIPSAVSRAQATLTRDDPRRSDALQLLAHPPTQQTLQLDRERLHRLIETGYEHSDQLHGRLRSFRNIVLEAATAITLFMAIFIVVVAINASWVPLCFTTATETTVCPTGTGLPSSPDIVIVALLGLLGGVMAGAVSINKLKGTSTPYDVPTALALLKAPFGAMTAVAAIIFIRGGFVPGLSDLDSQVQILAYAFVFGYAQQLLTGLIDKQAQAVLDSLPSMGAAEHHPEVVPATALPESLGAQPANATEATDTTPNNPPTVGPQPAT
jgi:hypothetical protein